MTSEREDVRLLKPIKEVWSETKAIIAKGLPEPTFRTWVDPMQLVEIANGEATIAITNEFCRTYANTHKEAIIAALLQVTNEKLEVKFIVDTSLASEYTPSIASITVVPSRDARNESDQALGVSSTPTLTPSLSPSSGPQINPSNYSTGAPPISAAQASLNPKYTFDTFVVGSHNRFCHSAALAVAERPGHSYNPLFVYGDVGLGKTHLLQAIGHEILRHSPKLNVKYISCERFTNELINSIRDDRMIDFRKRYRQVDVLMVDDIQFIEGKQSTQEEFFHTFNALRESGKQIVLSSDRPPKGLGHLEERLRSRFEWGLISDIQTPDLETRMAILKKKTIIDNMHVDDDVLQYIASQIVSNIRELEGALIRAHAYASLTSTPLTVQSVAGILRPVTPTSQKPTVTVDRVIESTAAHYRVEPSELRSAKRSQDLTLPRHVAMYLAHEMLQMSFPRIGQAFGNRKHTSALYAYNRIKEQIAKDADLLESIKQIRRQLGV